MERKTSDSQLRASRKYQQEHPDKRRRSVAKSGAKKFVLDYATTKELEDLRRMIDERLQSRE